MAKRPICKTCHKKPCTVNYLKDGKRFYRSVCLYCMRAKKQEKSQAALALFKSGYQKRAICDRCNFQAKHSAQLSIVFVDGNRLNASRQNLRTYCANCIAEISVAPNRRTGLVPDY